MEAQRFPGDFDGIIAGAPVLNFIDTMVNGLWLSRALEKAPISNDKLKVVEAALYAKCDKVDGVADGLIDDPRRCDFDPARDAPKCAAGQDGADCLTDAQAAALNAVYHGPRSNGAPFFFGFPPGAEKVGTDPFTGTQEVVHRPERRAGAPASLCRDVHALCGFRQARCELRCPPLRLRQRSGSTR
jgi:feruloyl esterase